MRKNRGAPGARWGGVAAVLLAGLMAVPAAAQPFQAFPVDEAGEDPALEVLRDELLDAVRNRDTDAVVALAAPDIRLSFGGHAGTETLRQWLIGGDGNPHNGEVYWQDLQAALELGGGFVGVEEGSRTNFCAPYTFVADVPIDMDVFTTVMIIRADAPLYGGPGTDHPVIGTLNYDIAEVTGSSGRLPEDPAAPYWLGIRTADGTQEGYVLSTDFRSVIDYRACFQRDPDTGAWTWRAFLAGD